MRWSPWLAAAGIPNLSIRFTPLPPETGGACCARRGGRVWVLIDPDLPPPDRRSCLAHELVHVERGSSCRSSTMPPTWDAVVIREELRVDREVARRLVPLDELELFVVRRAEVEPIDASLVADRFDVSVPIAGIALEQLAATLN